MRPSSFDPFPLPSSLLCCSFPPPHARAVLSPLYATASALSLSRVPRVFYASALALRSRAEYNIAARALATRALERFSFPPMPFV
eukprot:6193192-Pleurochrysis_carterae.AAC.1